MTEQSTAPDPDAVPDRWDEANDPDGYTYDDITPKDWVLDTLLDFMVGFDDDHQGSFGLTVTSAGVVVGGLVISRNEYIRRFVGLLHDNAGPELSNALNTVWTTSIERSLAEARRREEKHLPTNARRFLHMRDVRIWAPDGPVIAPLWRGNLADITGWSLGSHNPKQSAVDEG